MTAIKYLLSSGHKMDQYIIEKLLGEGTFGLVYLVKDSNTEERKAIKILKLWEVQPDVREQISERFYREFECGQINSDYLVRSEHHGKKNGNPYIVMDYCEGGSLSNLGTKRVSFDQIDDYARDVLKGLRDLHREGIVHRDLKPENVLTDAFGTARLTDFGIAGYQNARMTKRNILGHAQSIFGTYAYMPPEQLNNKISFKAMSPATDLYSFGATFYQVATGRLPFGTLKSQTELGPYVLRANKGEWKDPRIYRSYIPDYWMHIFKISLEPNYARRVQAAAELLSIFGVSQADGTNKSAEIDFCHDTVGLMVMNGEERGRIYNLSRDIDEKGGELHVGWYDSKNPRDNDIAIVEKHTSYVSRHHATIYKDVSLKKWMIMDGQIRSDHTKRSYKSSTNGTLVNSTEVGRQGHPLRKGDIITLGDTTLKIVVKE